MVYIKLSICFSGLSSESFSDRVEFYKPHSIETRSYVIEEYEAGLLRLDEYLKRDKSLHGIIEKWVGNSSVDWLDCQFLYIEHGHYMYGLSRPLTIFDIATIFKTSDLKVFCFVEVGGTSIHIGNGYFLQVPSSESIHNIEQPHVHVYKGRGGHKEGGTRYTFGDEVICLDITTRPDAFKRDEKKKIIPAIKKHEEELMAFWEKAKHNGIIPPAINESGKQFLIRN